MIFLECIGSRASMTVTPDAQGVAAVRVATGSSVFFAAR